MTEPLKKDEPHPHQATGEALLLELSRQTCDFRRIKWLVENGAPVNVQDAAQNTPLIFAAGQRHHEVTKLLIEHKADLDIQNIRGNTALMLTILLHGDSITLISLINAGANLNLQNQDGSTALMMAAEKGFASAVYRLLTAGADMSLKNAKGKTAQEIAADNQHPWIAEEIKAARVAAAEATLRRGVTHDMTVRALKRKTPFPGRP